MSKFTVTQRPLIEVQVSSEDIENDDGLISWLEQYATAPNQNETEYFMWIPPSMQYFKIQYGKEIPALIQDILETVLEATQNQDDHGYVLILIV